MNVIHREPIAPNWISSHSGQQKGHATARDINQMLSQLRIAEIEDQLVPFLAAAAAELALGVDIKWRFSPDDPTVALLRLIAKVSLKNPDAGGPHTDRLLQKLSQL